MKLFEHLKKSDFKHFFRNLTDAQLEFHEKGLEFWNNMLPIMDSIEIIERGL